MNVLDYVTSSDPFNERNVLDYIKSSDPDNDDQGHKWSLRSRFWNIQKNPFSLYTD